jgi:S-adenosyl-L-methionine hydrolase (adenosine-forming)
MVIALLTDFGTRDHYVATVKGVILGIAPTVTLIDITHEISAHDIRSGAFTLAACYADFPPETIFVCVVDPGVGSDRRAVAVPIDGRLFVGPDNGLIPMAVALRRLMDGATSAQQAIKGFEISNIELRRTPVSSTFHGRDIFAPAAAHLASGIPVESLGSRISDLVVLPLPSCTQAGSSMVGEVIHIDRFGNLVTNILNGSLPASFMAQVNAHDIDRSAVAYVDADDGVPFLIKGSSGLVEISIREQSASEMLCAAVGDPVSIKST